MPPRRSARVAAASECVAAAAERARTTLSPLPLALVLEIFSLLPVDTRLRCREVCRAWCATLENRSLWTRLDLREESITCFEPVVGLFGDDRRASWAALLRAPAGTFVCS
jgi:hypothetical protein